MAQLTRYTQKLFGSTAGTNQIAEFGSYAAGSPNVYSGGTITPAIIQTLANFLEGWVGAVIGQNSPAIEDMNAVCYLFAYQLCYIFQSGIPEWDAGTTYYLGSLVNSGGAIYKSVVTPNLNNAVSTSNWKPLASPSVTVITAASSPLTITSNDNGAIFNVDVTNGNVQFNAPSPATVGSGFSFKIVDSNGLFNPTGNYAILAPYFLELIVGLNANYNMQSAWGEWSFFTDGTNWFLA